MVWTPWEKRIKKIEMFFAVTFRIGTYVTNLVLVFREFPEVREEISVEKSRDYQLHGDKQRTRIWMEELGH